MERSRAKATRLPPKLSGDPQTDAALWGLSWLLREIIRERGKRCSLPNAKTEKERVTKIDPKK